MCNVFGVHRSSYKYWRQPKKPDTTRVTLLSLVRESYRESNGSAGARNITAMVTTKGVKLSRWRATKLMKELNLISCQQPVHRYKKADLALVTGQRREDISMFRFSDVIDGRLFVTQEKTGHKLAIPLDLRLDSANLVLKDVIEQCRENNPSDFMLYSSVRRGGRKPGPLTPDALTQAFSDTRDSIALKFGPNPPTYHEIRSLAGREYEKERGEEFAQRLLGHKNLTMTKKYLDARGAEYVMV